jgi:organic radical activating enzyme
MAKFEWSETFISVEGEAQFVGHPTAYIRFARCNFKCAGFNNPNNLIEPSGYAPLEYDPALTNRLEDLEPNEMGCDSQYAVNPDFTHIWHSGDENDLAEEVFSLLPRGQWNNPDTGTATILSLTGGEPTLRIKNWKALLDHPLLETLSHLLIETNCSVPLKHEHMTMLGDWIDSGSSKHVEERTVTWSNSPKLSNSGELWKAAIKPEVANSQLLVDEFQLSGNVNQYFKFVCDDSDKSFDEVAKAMAQYHDAGIPKNTPVYIMPESCVTSQQDEIAKNVALKCIDRGYILCYRVHMPLFANAIGT